MIGKLWPFALGSVALGLDAYVIAGLLPAIAGSLKASESSVGLGVAAFTGSYAIAGPILAGRAGQRSKQSLTIALAVFMLANVGTAVAPSIVTFLAARAIAGAAAARTCSLARTVRAGRGNRVRCSNRVDHRRSLGMACHHHAHRRHRWNSPARHGAQRR